MFIEEAEFTLADRAKMSYPLLLGREFLRDVAVVDGQFSASLGGQTPFPETDPADQLYLGLTVGDDVEQAPRLLVGGTLRAAWAQVRTSNSHRAMERLLGSSDESINMGAFYRPPRLL